MNWKLNETRQDEKTSEIHDLLMKRKSISSWGSPLSTQPSTHIISQVSRVAKIKTENLHGKSNAEANERKTQLNRFAGEVIDGDADREEPNCAEIQVQKKQNLIHQLNFIIRYFLPHFKGFRLLLLLFVICCH